MGGKVDARLKVAFALAWLVTDPELKKTDAVRLAEISLAIRATQALASFSTSLIHDLQLIIKALSTDDIPEAERNYYKSQLTYYQRISKNVDPKFCTLNEIKNLTTVLCSRTRKSNPIPKTNISAKQICLSSLRFRISKKILILDVILSVNLRKTEAIGIVSMSSVHQDIT